MRIRIDWKSFALGALAFVAVGCIPKVGDIVCKPMTAIRNKIGGK